MDKESILRRADELLQKANTALSRACRLGSSGRLPPRAPTDPYVRVSTHTVLQIIGLLRNMSARSAALAGDNAGGSC